MWICFLKECNFLPGISVSVLDAIESSELETLIKLFLAKGKASSTVGKGGQAAEALQSALEVSKIHGDMK